MRSNETGEFELVVGNRQLLSGFFIVVLLFAVAFAMGYVVGQNSPRSTKAMAETSAPPLAPADSVRPSASTAPPPQSAPAPVADTPAAAQAEAPPEPTTQPAREPDAPAAAELPPGSYWQVIAVAQQE